MKTVYEAAKEYAEYFGSERTKRFVRDGFRAGVEWAMLWFSVVNELPDYDVQVFVEVEYNGKRKFSIGELRRDKGWLVLGVPESFLECTKIVRWRRIDFKIKRDPGLAGRLFN